jgi:hypothetical protein
MLWQNSVGHFFWGGKGSGEKRLFEQNQPSVEDGAGSL